MNRIQGQSNEKCIPFLNLSDRGFSLVNKYGEILTDDREYGLLLFNNGTVCDTKGHGILDAYAAGAICKDIGYKSAGNMDLSDKPYWQIQLGFETSIYGISCPKKYDVFWYSCSYKVGSDKICERHSEDVFMKCDCNYSGSEITCPKGIYFKDKCLCTPCPRNTYKDIAGPETFCKACPRSSTSPPGSASCTCKAGYYWSLGRCYQCAHGSVSVEGSDECLICPQDSIEVNQRTACKCSQGKGWNWEENNKGECKPCLPGTYIAGDMTSCQACPRHTTSDVGSDHCICPAGMFWNNTQCQNCKRGSVSQRGALKCQICPLKSSKNGTSCECPSGEEWSWEKRKIGKCMPCLPGTYKALDMNSCQLCPMDTTSVDVGSDHCICPAGMFWNKNKCQNCEQGSVSQRGALRCQICPLKTSKNGTSCDCPKGKVWSLDKHLNMGSCKPLNSWKFRFLMGCNVGMFLLIVSIIVTLVILKLLKGRRYRRNSDVNVINTPYAE